MKNKLIRAKITFATEIVVENHYGEDYEKVAKDAWERNKRDIIDQANEAIISDVCEVKYIKDLPPGWDVHCLPWLPTITYGSSKQEHKIGEFLKK